MKSPTRSGTTIVTLTMNPALDITTNTDRVMPTDKMRCGVPRYDPGGGGINVARIAHVLGASVTALFPAGGHAGDKVTDLVAESGVRVQRIPVAHSTRESFTVDEDKTGKQYRFVLPGPQLTDAEQTECLETLSAAAGSADFVVASGSLPPGVPTDFYQRVADICRERGAPLILDTSGAGLRHISSGVFLLKPSVRELRECVERDLISESEQSLRRTNSSSAAALSSSSLHSGPRAPCLLHPMEANVFRLQRCLRAAAWAPATPWSPASPWALAAAGSSTRRCGWASLPVRPCC